MHESSESTSELVMTRGEVARYTAPTEESLNLASRR